MNTRAVLKKNTKEYQYSHKTKKLVTMSDQCNELNILVAKMTEDLRILTQEVNALMDDRQREMDNRKFKDSSKQVCK